MSAGRARLVVGLLEGRNARPDQGPNLIADVQRAGEPMRARSVARDDSELAASIAKLKMAEPL
jgi:hypothetical protein